MTATKQTLLFFALLALVPPTAPAQGDDRAFHITPMEVPVRVLDATESFEGLTDREKLYAHWMARASWVGALITFEQLSPESPLILEMFQRLFSTSPVALRRETTRRGVSDQDMEWLRQYAASFYSNCGNYLSFGDTKFIPRLAPEKLAIVVDAAATLRPERDDILIALWEQVRYKMYSLAPDELSLGMEDSGISAYYGEDVTSAEVELMKDFMQRRGMEAWNTRIFKDGDTLVLRVASAMERPPVVASHQDRLFRIEWGDYALILQDVVRSLERASQYAANDKQRRMIRGYIAHFNGGDIDDHKDASRWWVRDRGPVVETYIGFIETYRDPVHVRAEWEGFVSIVNKEQSANFLDLVNRAGDFIPLLPWNSSFEKDTYQKPDFTSLEVLAFANSGIPAGINIPNYDAIRMRDGFKNVSLGNVLRTGKDEKTHISFIKDEDQELFRTLQDQSFKVQVGLHELLGHGCGKLLTENADGTFNFDRNTKNPLTNERVATWYRPGQTWGSQFGSIASSYEECRAEAVGIYLSMNRDVLQIFGHQGQAASDLNYVNWLSMARAGLAALTFYDPDQKKWGQAHMQGRFALMRVMLEAGEGLLRLEQDDEGDWLIALDRTKIETVGKKAVGDFLRRLNIYKATADSAAGTALYDQITSVDDRFLTIREFVRSRRKPRHIWVQPVTDIDQNGRVILRTYPGTPQGVIDSFLDRYAFMYE